MEYPVSCSAGREVKLEAPEVLERVQKIRTKPPDDRLHTVVYNRKEGRPMGSPPTDRGRSLGALGEKIMGKTEAYTTILSTTTIALLLSACGGGNGGSPGSSPMIGGGNLPAFAVNRDSARALVSGETLDMTSAEIDATLNTLSQTADSVITSDFFLFPAGGIPARIGATCDQDSCTVNYAGRSETIPLPTDLDFIGNVNVEHQSVMTHNEVNLAQQRARLAVPSAPGELTDIRSYGGWLEHNFFFWFSLEQTLPTADDYEASFAVSIGDATGSNPGANATWNGVMAGGDVSDSISLQGNVIQGDATINLDFSESNVDVSFTNIYDLNTRRQRNDMNWMDIPAADGTFGEGFGANQIYGQFYGPSHEEVGGVFERDNIVGAFGAKKE